MVSERRRTRPGQYVLLAIVIIVVLGAILVGAYYQADIGTYLSLQGWNPAPAEQTVRSFIQSAAKQDPAAKEYLDPDFVKPVEADGKLTAVQVPGPAGPIKVPVDRVIPSPEVKEVASRIKYKAG